MLHFLYVAIGGAIGASLRHLINLATLRMLGVNFPWGTMTVNVLGSFAMGVFVELLVRRFDVSQEVRLLVTTGIIGSFTTFSAFSLDVAVLWERGASAHAAIYAGATVVLSITALFAGMAVIRAFSG